MAPIVSCQEILTQLLPPIDWLAQGLIVNGDRVLVYGEPGAMKSWLLLDLALHLATATPWLGRYAVQRARRVLYIDEEMSARTMYGRVRRLVRGLGFVGSDIPFRTMTGWGGRFEDDNSANQLLATVQSFDPEVVIIESLRSVIAGDENSAGDVRIFWRRVEPFRQRNKTLIVSHHMRKPQKGPNNPTHRASGSTDLIAGPDTAMAVLRNGRQQLLELVHIKCRNGQEHAPIKVRVQDHGREEDCPVTIQAINASSGGTISADEEIAAQIIEHLRTCMNRRNSTKGIKQHFGQLGISKDRVDKGLRYLANDPRVFKPKRGFWELRPEEEALVNPAPAVAAESPLSIETAVAATTRADHRANSNGSTSSDLQQVAGV
ncbi:MAG: AAA family ATPase [Nitrospira sp.]|nr:AAA family ATPase [Nitrospira sp.]MBH0185624.1 AAA family ATPase [Nitrospira sp.]